MTETTRPEPIEPYTIRAGDRVLFNGMPGTVARAYLGDRREHEVVLDGRAGLAYAFESELHHPPPPSAAAPWRLRR